MEIDYLEATNFSAFLPNIILISHAGYEMHDVDANGVDGSIERLARFSRNLSVGRANSLLGFMWHSRASGFASFVLAIQGGVWMGDKDPFTFLQTLPGALDA